MLVRVEISSCSSPGEFVAVQLEPEWASVDCPFAWVHPSSCLGPYLQDSEVVEMENRDEAPRSIDMLPSGLFLSFARLQQNNGISIDCLRLGSLMNKEIRQPGVPRYKDERSMPRPILEQRRGASRKDIGSVCSSNGDDHS